MGGSGSGFSSKQLIGQRRGYACACPAEQRRPTGQGLVKCGGILKQLPATVKQCAGDQRPGFKPKKPSRSVREKMP